MAEVGLDRAEGAGLRPRLDAAAGGGEGLLEARHLDGIAKRSGGEGGGHKEPAGEDTPEIPAHSLISHAGFCLKKKKLHSHSFISYTVFSCNKK